MCLVLPCSFLLNQPFTLVIDVTPNFLHASACAVGQDAPVATSPIVPECLLATLEGHQIITILTRTMIVCNISPLWTKHSPFHMQWAITGGRMLFVAEDVIPYTEPSHVRIKNGPS